MSRELPRRLPIAVLISGGGTTLKNLLDQSRLGKLDVDFRLVVSSSEQAKGLEFARERTVPTCIVERQRCDSDDAFSRPIFDACRAHGAELVVMGGFLKFVPIPPDFNHRVMNIHPALIPAFSGPGFYGRRVHQAVLDYGAKVSGCTVHFVDNQFDHGPIILQRTVEVRDSDKPETL
jgi:phosphoribosylglycinamide formyltransferase 1